MTSQAVTSKPISKTTRSPVAGAARIFDLSLGELIWSFFAP